MGLFTLQPLLAGLQAIQAAVAIPQIFRQFVAAFVRTEGLVLFGILGRRFGQHLFNFGFQVLQRAIRRQRGVGLDLRAVQRNLAEIDQAGLPTQPQHFEEQTFQVRLVVLAEAADCGVVGRLVCRDDLVRHIRLAGPLDPSAGPLACAVGVQQQADHHRRIEGRVADAVGAVLLVKRLQVDLFDGIENEPRQMAFRQPVRQRRRQEIRLIPVA